MSIFTSRFSNKELQKGTYTAVRISLGTPRWQLGYSLAGAIKEIMPTGLLGKYDNDKAAFQQKYFEILEKVGVQKIREQLQQFEQLEHDVVLLCYEDIRTSEENWCHRTMFAEWWQAKTGEQILELSDISIAKTPKPKPKIKPARLPDGQVTENVQLNLF
ncbi:MAG: hypothetical protein FWG64_09130 [Firmicutes bacterium]|nr:hypothetical protein [Bacillota bacterium]